MYDLSHNPTLASCIEIEPSRTRRHLKSFAIAFAPNTIDEQIYKILVVAGLAASMLLSVVISTTVAVIIFHALGKVCH